MKKIIYNSEPSLEEIAILENGLNKEAKTLKNLSPMEHFSFFIKDKKILGGVFGEIIYGSIYTDLLWVDKSLRGQGYGTKLLKKVENFGKEKNCTFSTLNTFNWQALEFYQKLGYEIEFKRSGYHNNSTCYFLKKEI